MHKKLTALLLVRPGEIKPVAYFFGLFLLFGMGMAFGQSTADALFFKRYGIQYLPATYIGLGFVLCFTSILYAATADRLPAERLFKVILPILIAAISVTWALMQFTAAEFVYPLYYLIYKVASELLVVHSGLYVAQNFEILQAKRLAAPIMAGSQVGIILGGAALPFIVPLVGVQNVLLAWIVILLVGLVLLQFWHSRTGTSTLYRSHREKGAGGVRRALEHIAQGIRYLRESPLQRAASMALFFLVIAFHVLSYSANRIYTTSFASEQSLAAFFGTLTALTSAVALALQLFVTNRVMGRIGVKNVNLVFPVTTLLSFGWLLASFSFVPALFSSFNKDAVMPAFREPARHVILAALPGKMQGRAGATALAVVLPAGLLVSGSLLWVAQDANNPAYFLMVGLVAALFYLGYSLRMNKAYAGELIQHLRKTLTVPGGLLDGSLRGGDAAVLRELRKGVLHEDPQVSLIFAKAFLAADPGEASGTILKRAANADDPLQDQLLRLLVPHNPVGLDTYLLERISAVDGHLRATMLTMLFKLRNASAASFVDDALRSDNPRLAAAGIFGSIQYPVDALREIALERWQSLLDSSDPGQNLAGLELQEHLTACGVGGMEKVCESARDCILRNLEAGGRVQIAALTAIDRWPLQWPEALAERLAQVYESPDWRVRERCILALARTTGAVKQELLSRVCEDQDPRVRKVAVASLNDGSESARSTLIGWLTSGNWGSPRSQQSVLTNLQEHGLAPEALIRIAIAKTKEAEEIASALMAVTAEPSQSHALQLFAMVLEERLQQIIDLALMALQPLAEPGTITAIRSALKSRDRRHVADACEGFRNVGNKQIARALADLMEYFVAEDRSAGSAGQYRGSVSEVLDWAMNRSDPWLRNCAEYARRTLGGGTAYA